MKLFYIVTKKKLNNSLGIGHKMNINRIELEKLNELIGTLDVEHELFIYVSTCKQYFKIKIFLFHFFYIYSVHIRFMDELTYVYIQANFYSIHKLPMCIGDLGIRKNT